jgi:hypothetical protein
MSRVRGVVKYTQVLAVTLFDSPHKWMNEAKTSSSHKNLSWKPRGVTRYDKNRVSLLSNDELAFFLQDNSRIDLTSSSREIWKKEEKNWSNNRLLRTCISKEDVVVALGSEFYLRGSLCMYEPLTYLGDEDRIEISKIPVSLEKTFSKRKLLRQERFFSTKSSHKKYF